MPLLIPPAVNYRSPWNALPSNSQDEPREGRKQAAFEILWGPLNMGGPNNCVHVDLSVQQGASVALTQISSLQVNNSESGQDVTFIFTDTFETIVIPAGSPYELIPVLSNSLDFYVYAPGATPEDVTRFVITNYVVEAASVAQSEANNAVASTSDVWLLAGTTTQLIPAGVNGTIENFQAGTSFKVAFAVNSFAQVQVRDGAGTIFVPGWKLGFSTAGTATGGSTVQMNFQNWNQRFRNGLIVQFSVIAGWGAAELNANMFVTYRQP